MAIPARKKIVFVSNTLWSIYNFRFYLIKALLERGFEVYAIAPLDKYKKQFENIDGLHFVELKNLNPHTFSPLSDLKLYSELKKIYKQIQPDLIFHYTIKVNIYGSYAAFKARCKSVAVVTGLGFPFIKKKLIKTIASTMYSFSLKKAIEVWFLNEENLRSFVEHGIIPESKSFLLPGEGVDTAKYHPLDSVAVSRSKFLMIARPLYNKGVLEYAQAAQMLKKKGVHADFDLLGLYNEDSPDALRRADFEKWISSGIVNYLNHADDVRPLIASSDCVVLPSYGEGMSRSLMEAASMEKPLIVSDVCGCREIVVDQVSGLICKPESANDLAVKMESFLQLATDKKTAMGKRGRELMIQKFDQQIILGIYFDKLTKLLN
jgi:glycosyltransferase involved in cell wall biosynthesis